MLLGVSCDGECGECLEADFMVRDSDSIPTRFGYVLDYAATKGWLVKHRDKPLFAMTFCPACIEGGEHL